MKRRPEKKHQTRKILIYLAVSVVIALAALIVLFLVVRDAQSYFNSISTELIFLFACMAGLIFFMFLIAIPMISVEKVLIDVSESDSEVIESSGHLSKSSYLQSQLEEIIDSYRQSVDREYSTRLLKQQAELSNLQSQINPHFLYNTLEAIRGKALIEDVDDIAEMAEALATLFRYSISRKGDLVTVEEELNNLESYIFIQQYRFNNKFDVAFHTESDELLHTPIPRMSVQPLVENAIYHGLETKVGKGSVAIHLSGTQSRVILSVKDNGTGIPEQKLIQLNRLLSEGKFPQEVGSNEMGIALLNVNKRLKMYFGEIYGIRLFSTYGIGTEVVMEIPQQLESGTIQEP
ncbi:MAG: sensor histidine kinase [Christensenellaceae bacterium]|jgi:two-component system sensor histidine kinase YesM